VQALEGAEVVEREGAEAVEEVGRRVGCQVRVVVRIVRLRRKIENAHMTVEDFL